MRSTLSISPTPAPFRSSHLAVPPSPFSPQIPISPGRSTTKPTTSSSNIAIFLPPPPQEPLKWLWQCHQCARIYHLGTTRRCLDDGHYFCAGAPVTKRDRKTGQRVTRKSRACASEFDYQGWRNWAAWRRDVEEQRAAAVALKAFEEAEEEAVESDGELRVEDVKDAADVPRPLFAYTPQEGVWFSGAWGRKSEVTPRAVMALPEKDCWGTCDYPSECRWGKQFGAAQTQAQAQVVVAPAAVAPSPPPPPPPASMVDEPVAKDLERRNKTSEKLSTLPATIEEVPEADETVEISDHIHEDPSTTVQETTKKPTFDDLLESAKRRKRRSAGVTLPSPLASNPPSPTGQEEQEQAAASANNLQKAFDDFELDLKKSIGRASVLLNGFVLGLKGDGLSEDEKAEAFVKDLRTDRKKKRTAKEDDRQSLSD